MRGTEVNRARVGAPQLSLRRVSSLSRRHKSRDAAVRNSIVSAIQVHARQFPLEEELCEGRTHKRIMSLEPRDLLHDVRDAEESLIEDVHRESVLRDKVVLYRRTVSDFSPFRQTSRGRIKNLSTDSSIVSGSGIERESES